MTLSLYRARFYSSAGFACGGVRRVFGERGCVEASLAFERPGDAGMLESPVYYSAFAVGEERQARRALLAAARRRLLSRCTDRAGVPADRLSAQSCHVAATA